jgi:DNA-binding IclR family transcriptional regulator
MIQSVQRAMQILSILAESLDGLGVGEVAVRAGLTTSTAHNLLATLADGGFAERLSGPPRYRIGPGLTELSGRQESGHWKRALDEAVLEAARQLSEATVVQCEYVAGEIIARRRCSPERRGQLQRPSHQPMSPYFSASGLCWLAFGPRDDGLAIFRRFPLSDYAGHRWACRNDLTAYLNSVRSVGYVSEASGDLMRVSVPLYGSGNNLIATLGASIPAIETSDEHHLARQIPRVLQDIASNLSDALQRRQEQINVDQ